MKQATVPATPRKKEKPTIRRCAYCGAPSLLPVCAAHLDLLGKLEAER